MKSTRALLLLIPVAIIAIGLAMPSFALTSPKRLTSVLPFFQTDDASTCRELDRSFIQFDVSLEDDAGFETGRVVSLNDGTLALLLVVSDIDDQTAVTAVDFATSIRIGALIVRGRDTHDAREFDPPIRSGSGLRAPGDGPIDSISFCYHVNIPSPPRPGTAEATPASTIESTATVLTLDLSAAETARANTESIEQTATAEAISAANAIASARAEAAAIVASATAAAVSYDATIAAQADELATLQAELATASAGAAALEATLAAPTMTPLPTDTPMPTSTPEPTATATPTVVVSAAVVYETSGDAPFTEWQSAEGWDLSGATAKSDGSGAPGWLVFPVPSGLSADVVIDLELRVTGGDLCPRNFGVAARGSESGYYAAGIEWACDPEAVLWAGSEAIEREPVDGVIELGSDWRQLRFSVLGDGIQLSIDGRIVASAADDRYDAGNLVALWTDGVGLEIRFARISEVSS